MSERRPHWTNDLIEAVYAELPAKKYQVEPDSWEVHRIIAAVEDWARWEHVPKGTLARLEQAEAAIERVRDVCEQWQNYDAVDWATAPYLLVTDKLTAAKQILQALDGAS